MYIHNHSSYLPTGMQKSLLGFASVSNVCIIMCATCGTFLVPLLLALLLSLAVSAVLVSNSTVALLPVSLQLLSLVTRVVLSPVSPIALSPLLMMIMLLLMVLAKALSLSELALVELTSYGAIVLAVLVLVVRKAEMW